MTDIITIASSDDESELPKSKRIKPTPVLSECTLTPINSKSKENGSKSSKKTSDVVELFDSEEDISENQSQICVQTDANNIAQIELITIEDFPEGYCKDTHIEKVHIQSSTNIHLRQSAVDGDDLILVDDREMSGRNKVDTNNILHETLQAPNTRNCNLSESNTNILVDKNSSDEKENASTSIVSGKVELSQSPTTKQQLDSNRILLNDFLELIRETVKNSRYEGAVETKIPIIRKYFKRIEPTLSRSKLFETQINKYADQAKISPYKAIIECSELFTYIKINMENVGQVDIEEKHVYKVKKLEKTMELLITKIHEFETTEVNFEEDENSAYIQIDRYTKRLHKVYLKYCQYLKKNPYSGRLTHDKIFFCESKYNEINLAINSQYKNSLKCPEYYKIEKCIKNVVRKENLDLNELEIKSESKKCFEKLAEVLQRRRKTELYDFHSQYIENTQDPACDDQLLDSTLKKNYEMGKQKINEIFETFVRRQDEKQGKQESDNSEESSDEEINGSCEKSSLSESGDEGISTIEMK